MTSCIARGRLLVFTIGIGILGVAGPAFADHLRIVSYNVSINDNPAGNVARAGMSTVLQAIGLDTINGIQRPIDVMSLQQIDTGLQGSASIVGILNSLYGPGTYARTTVVGANDGNFQSVVYNTHTVQLLSQTIVSAPGAPRDSLRVELRPLGYGSASDFYLYSDHYESGTSSGDLSARLAEANAVRANAAALPAGSRVIFSGDMNTQNSSEAGYSALTAGGTGQAIDPLAMPGNWHANAAFAALHTQAALVNQPANSDLTGGGVDDRFDFQLITASLVNGPGMRYSPGSYHVFGNNGTTFNDDINDAGNTALPLAEYHPGPGQPSRASVLNALSTASDHLPVVVDYYVPEPSSLFSAVIAALALLGFRLRRHVRQTT